MKEKHKKTPEVKSPFSPEFELMAGHPRSGVFRRFFTTQRHFFGLVMGGAVATVERLKPQSKELGLSFLLLRIVAFFIRPLVKKSYRHLPFAVQLRKRLEILGPTYIKLGQVLSLRQDILPKTITEELENLLDRLPVVPFDIYRKLIEKDLKRPTGEMFTFIDPNPLGSASIAQIHRAKTIQGVDVVLKVVKPGIITTLKRDALLLGLFSRFLEIFFSRYQPRRMIKEFVDYTMREVDFRIEADNAEIFRANFQDMPDVVFPEVYKEYSGERVLCQAFLDGLKPTSPDLKKLPLFEREKLIDVGASAIIRMLYQDGFFHADLHPGNLIVLRDGRCGFIDLGMVGRFGDELRRSLLYYYYCLVIGDANNAARYLTSVADTGPYSDPKGFQRAAADIARRWHRNSNFKDFSLAQLVLESVTMGGQYRMYFPVEMVLMVKSLVTFEGVGNFLIPGFDVAKVSKKHISRLFFQQFSPANLIKEHIRMAPDMVDAYLKAPLLINEALRYFERKTRQPARNPFQGVKEMVLAGSFMIAGSILAAVQKPWYVWSLMFLVAFMIANKRKSE
ncbi:MAG: ubiquinone biosynthesis protein UbiB [Acidobacteria bacterium]|nr:MAG: ubiquinone biosynthesis protein UbiB [Acidobacteriota bacterium]